MQEQPFRLHFHIPYRTWFDSFSPQFFDVPVIPLPSVNSIQIRRDESPPNRHFPFGATMGALCFGEEL